MAIEKKEYNKKPESHITTYKGFSTEIRLLPLINRASLLAYCDYIISNYLDYNITIDKEGSIGRRIARARKDGVIFLIVDHKTLENRYCIFLAPRDEEGVLF